METEVVECIYANFKDSCKELFSSLNCDVTLQDSCLANVVDPLVAVVDAGSCEVAVIVSLEMPMSVLALTYPATAEIIQVSDEILEDWSSELANQLIGRLKNKLIGHNCTMDIGLPTCYIHEKYEDAMQVHAEIKNFYFDIDGEDCACHISVEIFNQAENFQLEKSNDDISSEGELELF